MRALVAGGAGFIGSHSVAHLLRQPSTSIVTVVDRLADDEGARRRLPHGDSRLRTVSIDIGDLSALCEVMRGHDAVFHFASNPDIARAIREPDVDFWQGTYLTHNILEAMRRTGVPEIVYASGSGVYGEAGNTAVSEDHGPLLPISTYAASKLAGEALVSAYCQLFPMRGWTFRFANVVGSNQTHGVIYDFISKLSEDPRRLQILGDGTQSKSYIHVDDVLSGIWTARSESHDAYNYFNVATDDYLTVREIADIVTQIMKLSDVHFVFTGGSRGWKGDVPIVRIDTRKLRAIGWRPERSSRAAVEAATTSMVPAVREPT